MYRLLFILTTLSLPAYSETSSLWGEDGENWKVTALFDYSAAGYREGASLPDEFSACKQIDVTSFGAVPNDGKDDTAAFRKALESASGRCVINIPEGHFSISDRLTITTPTTVLRGKSKTKTILEITTGLEDIDPKPTKNAGGTPTSSYSWSGGFLRIIGKSKASKVGVVTELAPRGTRRIKLDTAKHPPKLNDRIRITQRSSSNQALLRHVYADDPGNISKVGSEKRLALYARVVKIDGTTLWLDRPLPCDVRPEWAAEVAIDQPTLQYSGIESLTVSFPPHTYRGHFTERGYNAINIKSVSDCWVRDIAIINADSGIFLKGVHCTITDVTLSSPDVKTKNANQPDHNTLTGHHGIIAGGCYNLVEKIDFQCVFIHDLTVSGSFANVFCTSKGINMSLDHHKRGPFSNLFTDLDLGHGSRFLKSGGGANLGRNSGAWSTFWNIRSENPVSLSSGFAPIQTNFVGVNPSKPQAVKDRGYHLEIAPRQPTNLYQAQAKKRAAAK